MMMTVVSRCSFVDMPQQVHAVGAWHAQVGDHQLGTAFIDYSASLFAVFGKRDFIAGFFQLHLQNAANAGIVIHDDNEISIHADSRLTEAEEPL